MNHADCVDVSQRFWEVFDERPCRGDVQGPFSVNKAARSINRWGRRKRARHHLQRQWFRWVRLPNGLREIASTLRAKRQAPISEPCDGQR